VRGVDYEGKFSHFSGELYMLYVVVNGNGFFVERFCRLCDEIFTVLVPGIFIVSMYVQVISEMGYFNGILHLL